MFFGVPSVSLSEASREIDHFHPLLNAASVLLVINHRCEAMLREKIGTFVDKKFALCCVPIHGSSHKKVPEHVPWLARL